MSSNRIRGIRKPIPPGTVLARIGGGYGPPVPVKIGQLLQSGNSLAALINAHDSALPDQLDAIGAVQGDILYRNATVWTVLAPGTAGYHLKTGGAAADPAWTHDTIGTVTNDDAPAGYVGQLIESNVASPGVTLTSTTAADITSLALTKGDWDVWGNIGFNPDATTTMTILRAWSSIVSATQPTAPNGGALQQLALAFPAGNGQVLSAGTQRIKLAADTTVYLSTKCTFAVAALTAYGYIAARRRR